MSVLQGPAIRILPESESTVLDAAHLTDPVDVPGGLSAEVEDQRLRVTFASSEMERWDCQQRVFPGAGWWLVGTPTDRRVVGYVQTYSSDACVAYTDRPVEETRSRMAAVTPELPPGEVRVIVVEHPQCFCPWSGFRAHELLVQIPETM